MEESSEMFNNAPVIYAVPSTTTGLELNVVGNACDPEIKNPRSSSLLQEVPVPPSQQSSPNKRKRRPVDRGLFLETDKISKTARRKPKKQQVDTETEFETVWICVECKEAECMMKPEATQLLICDGLCRRLFHYPCAGLEQLPSEEEEFICEDCAFKKHACAICSNYGTDNEDVFKCLKSTCGLFFHLSCLAMQNVDLDVVDCVENEDAGTIAATLPASKPRFICPAHSCWTCTQTDLRERETSETKIGGAGLSKAKRGGRGKKKAKPSSTFETKVERFLTRCLECPIAYHVSCIPPSAKFHELATLCHEHSATGSLPELDPDDSFQQTIENKADKKFEAFVEQRKRRAVTARASTKNPFFRDMSGDAPTKREKDLLDSWGKDGELEYNTLGGCYEQLMSSFCLPCDIKDEVHSKPPQYSHVQSLQYDPRNKPPRILPSSDVCQCVTRCDENCINRMLYTECFGDATNVDNGGTNSSRKAYNCLLGPNCGNRQIGQRRAAKCKPVREQGKGWGLCTVKPAGKGDLIQEYVGEVIDAVTKEERLNQWTEEHPNDPNFYIMALQPGWFIDARGVANLARFINHSCEPNCSLTQINVSGRLRCGIFAMRDIKVGEFLSYDYHFDTRDGDRFVCRCGSSVCRGTMKGGSAVQLESSRKSKKEIWEEAKTSFERDKKFLADFHVDREKRRMQVDAVVPGGGDGGGNDDFVSNGPQIKHRDHARGSGIFLWRNAMLGDDFSARFAKLPL